MSGHKRRRFFIGAGALAAAFGLAACPGNSPTPPPEEFALVEVQQVGEVGGGAYTWLVGLDLINREGNGQYRLRFLAPDDCVSETAGIFVPSGRDWEDDFAVNCRLQPREVIVFSLRPSGFQVTDRDSIPLLPEP